MSALDDITSLAQDTYRTINGNNSNATNANLTAFQNNFIADHSLWLDEFEHETDWNAVRTNDYVLATIGNTSTFVFPLPDDYRKPVFTPDKELKFVNDGSIIARFDLVAPDQINSDMDPYTKNKATFIGRNIVLSRPATDSEVGSQIQLDVVGYFPRLSTRDSSVISMIPRQLQVLGVAKNSSLSSIVKGGLSPSFSQKYADLLNAAISENAASTVSDWLPLGDFSSINGVW